MLVKPTLWRDLKRLAHWQTGGTLRFRYLAEGGRWLDEDTLSPRNGDNAVIAV